jgi:dipeptidyl aminopeptidase/acylaminoacyl peptidase
MSIPQFIFVLWLCLGRLCAAENAGSDVERAVFYPSANLRVMAHLFLPAKAVAGQNRPVILFNHGGIDGLTENAKRRCRELRDAGFVVLASSYRGEDASEGQVEIAKGEVDDVLAGLDWLDQNATSSAADTTRVALLGFSHGALIGLQAAKKSKRFRAMVFAYGVSDIYQWLQYLRDSGQLGQDALSQSIYGTGPESRPEQYAARFGLGNLAQLQRGLQVLIVQGERDVIVPPNQARALALALKGQGIRHKILLYPHATHGFLIRREALVGAEKRESSLAWAEIIGFLQRSLAR